MCAPPEHRPGKNTSHLLNSRIAQPILFQNYLSDGNMKRFVSAARSSICFILVIIFLLFLASKSFFFFSFSFPNKPVELLEIYSDLNLKLIRNASVCLLLTFTNYKLMMNTSSMWMLCLWCMLHMSSFNFWPIHHSVEQIFLSLYELLLHSALLERPAHRSLMKVIYLQHCFHSR